ncbi:hypothetical protein PG984_011211 [Apiospora sp. TS-2023a]
MDVDSTDATGRALETFQQRYPETRPMERAEFVLICSHLKLLLDLGYEPPHSAYDAFIAGYLIWKGLPSATRNHYHTWFSEYAARPGPLQVLSDHALEEIAAENMEHVAAHRAEMLDCMEEVLASPTNKHEHPASAQTVNGEPAELDFFYTPYSHPAGRAWAAPSIGDTVALQLAYLDQDGEMVISMFRGDVFVGSIKRGHLEFARQRVNSSGRIQSVRPIINLKGGGRCTEGTVRLL